ncbi:MAG: glycosyltransferase, partial [Verrucomicrobia bacterium]|nr:glycosyltransferase [Cytophagales bacterium]
ELLKKYQIKKPYFFSPNQFWQHKNQLTLLKAIKVLKERDIKTLVIFSGKEEDYRNPDYFKGLKQYVIENKIEDFVQFLGFIDRREQLKLMQYALSIVQPSLFEGWSTVIEDCKAMNQFVLVSDIPVHHEQIKENAIFFNPTNEYDLASKIENVLNNPPIKTNCVYQIALAGTTFMKIIHQLS